MSEIVYDDVHPSIAIIDEVDNIKEITGWVDKNGVYYSNHYLIQQVGENLE